MTHCRLLMPSNTLFKKHNSAGCSRFTKDLPVLINTVKHQQLQSKSGSKSHRIVRSSKSKNGSHLIIWSTWSSGTFAQPKKIVIQQFFVSFGMWATQIMSFKQLAPKTETIKIGEFSTIHLFEFFKKNSRKGNCQFYLNFLAEIYFWGLKHSFFFRFHEFLLRKKFEFSSQKQLKMRHFRDFQIPWLLSLWNFSWIVMAIISSDESLVELFKSGSDWKSVLITKHKCLGSC